MTIPDSVTWPLLVLTISCALRNSLLASILALMPAVIAASGSGSGGVGSA